MKRCYETVGQWMRDAGMAVSIDAGGNLRGVRPGREPGKRVFLLGSHLDTVRDAGAFDGILGVVLGIAIVEKFTGQVLPFDIQVIGFSEEEGVRFGFPFIGSQALVGSLDEETLNRVDSAGVTVAEAIREFGITANIWEAKLGTRPLGFIEFHIEQGPVLDKAGESVAVVAAIVGQTRASVKFVGSANHAGTTPMTLRRDAMAAASEWISAVERVAVNTDGLVATTGKLEVHPNQVNVIPGEVTVWLDVRHADDKARQSACVVLRRLASQMTDRRELKLFWEDVLDQKAVRMDDSLTRVLESASPAGIRQMVSGAGHDAMILAPHMPTAMLFLRSPGGVSHHPTENVLPEDVDLALGIGVRCIESMKVEYNLA
jgi:allantoate deiminase